MKAIRKSDGKEVIVDPKPTRYLSRKVNEYGFKDMYLADDLIWNDWEAFRREAAKDILCSMIRSGGYINCESLVSHALDMTNELLKQLKENNESSD